MPRPLRLVSPAPGGPAEGRSAADQDEVKDGAGAEGEARNLLVIFRTSKVWEGGKMEETAGLFFMRVGDEGIQEGEEKLR